MSILNWGVFLLVNGLALYSAYCLASCLTTKAVSDTGTQSSPQSLSLTIVAGGIIYFAHLTLVVLVLGVVVRSLTPVSVPLLSLLLSIALLYFFRHHRQPVLCPILSFLKTSITQRELTTLLVLVLLIVQVVILLTKVVIFPPHIWDVFVYHLSPAVEWYQQGFIPSVIESPVNRINGAPLGMTVLAYWFFIFFQQDFLVEMPALLWSLLLLPVVYAAMRQAQVSRAWSLKFAVLIFFTPVVLMLATGLKDHLGLNVALVAALVFLVEFIRNRQTTMLLLAAVAFGLMLGYKIVAPIHIAVVLILFLVMDRAYRRKLGSLDVPLPFSINVKTASWSVLIMTLLGGYWYIKNLIVFGRIEGTYRMGVANQLIASGAAQPAQKTSPSVLEAVAGKFTQMDSLSANLEQFFARIFDGNMLYSADLIGISGFGPQFVAFGLLAIVATIVALFIRKYRSEPWHYFAYAGLALFLVYMPINYNPNSYRLLSFFPMLMIAYAAMALTRSGMLKDKLVAGGINGLIVAALAWNMFHMLPPQETNPARVKEFVSLDMQDRTSANYTHRFALYRPSFYRVLQNLPADEPLAYVAANTRSFPGESAADTWTYLYYDHQWRRPLTFIYRRDYLDCDKENVCTPKPALYKKLEEKDIRYLSTCKINRCLTLKGKGFTELLPGFYYFQEGA